MNSPPQLRELQAWMQALVTSATSPLVRTTGEAADDSDSGVKIEAVIAPSPTQTARERLAVYHNAYFARLFECLRDFFPATAAAMGTDLFDEFAVGYLQTHPSTTYTLNRLADHFVEFLETTRPASADGSLDICDFFIELARLEWYIDAVFDGAGSEDAPPLAAADLAAVSPSAWPETRLLCSPSLRPLAFRFPVNDCYSEFRAGRDVEVPTPRDSFVLLYRRDFVVRRWEMTREQFLLLEDLIGGATIGDALLHAAARDHDLTNRADELRAWFAAWTSAGLFVGLVTAN